MPAAGKSEGEGWRPHPESNRGARICNPLRHHSAIGPAKNRVPSKPFTRFQSSVLILACARATLRAKMCMLNR